MFIYLLAEKNGNTTNCTKQQLCPDATRVCVKCAIDFESSESLTKYAHARTSTKSNAQLSQSSVDLHSAVYPGYKRVAGVEADHCREEEERQ